jgi:hypothetical protein
MGFFLNWYAFAADFLVAIHLVYVLFVVVGEVVVLLGWILKWKWVRNLWLRLLHFAAIGGVAFLAISKQPCPLTIWEYELREMAGQIAEWDISFIGRLIRMVVFQPLPAWVFLLIYVGFAGLVLLTLLFVPPIVPWKKKKNAS